MKKLALIAGFVILSFLVTSCYTQGTLNVIDFDYAKDYNLQIYGRSVEFTILVHNPSNKQCVIAGVSSPHFWNYDNPGLSGTYKEVINVELNPGDEYVLKIFPFLRDGDIILSHEKNFELNLFADENCEFDTSILVGHLNIDVGDGLVADDVITPILYSDEIEE